VPASAATPSSGAGYRPAHTDALELRLAVVARPKVSGAPPWGPAPRPPGLVDQRAPAQLATSDVVPPGATSCPLMPRIQRVWRLHTYALTIMFAASPAGS